MRPLRQARAICKRHAGVKTLVKSENAKLLHFENKKCYPPYFLLADMILTSLRVKVPRKGKKNAFLAPFLQGSRRPAAAGRVVAGAVAAGQWSAAAAIGYQRPRVATARTSTGRLTLEGRAFATEVGDGRGPSVASVRHGTSAACTNPLCGAPCGGSCVCHRRPTRTQHGASSQRRGLCRTVRICPTERALNGRQ